MNFDYLDYLFMMLHALFLTLAVMPISISYLKKLKFGQVEREEGLDSHKSKNGTPTMGGIVFILVSILIAYIFNNYYKPYPYVNLLTFAFLGFGLIGFIDDYLIVVRKSNEGLKPAYKYGLQSLFAIAFYFLAKEFAPNFSSQITLKSLNLTLDLKFIYPVLVYFIFTACSNAVNLSDGLDGLCTGLVIFALIPFIVSSYIVKNYQITYYLLIVEASLLGFLVFNIHPAKIFMGDTGSLALGGLIGAAAILTKNELMLILIGGVFLVETLSVILQVLSFKLTKKKIFKMSPLHHHFELCGWSEKKVVLSFWIVGIILSIISIFIII